MQEASPSVAPRAMQSFYFKSVNIPSVVRNIFGVLPDTVAMLIVNPQLPAVFDFEGDRSVIIIITIFAIAIISLAEAAVVSPVLWAFEDLDPPVISASKIIVIIMSTA